MSEMKGRYKPYSGYKGSGVNWLGSLPEHWDAKRLKDCVSGLETGGTPESDRTEYWSDDESGTPWVAIADMTKSFHVVNTARRLTTRGLRSKRLPVLPRGTLLYSMYASLGKVAILDVDAVVNQAILGIIPREDIATRDFLRWWLTFMEGHVTMLSNSSTQDNLNAEKVRTMPVFIPPAAQQRAIAAFLDRETARIDALVAKKERLIEVLEERRRNLITHVVTRGLDPHVPLKDSGVEWLGEIPRHWEIKRLWHLTPSRRRIMYGIVLPGPNVDGGIPIVKGGDVSEGRLRLDLLSRTTSAIESAYVRSRLRGGDLVFAIRGSIGEVAMVPEELTGANLTQDAARIAYTARTNGAWLMFALKSAVVFSQLEAGALGATIKGINIRDLKRALIPVPPLDEQIAIAKYVTEATARFDRLTATVKDAVRALGERRTALISAAVTGKIDVREEVA